MTEGRKIYKKWEQEGGPEKIVTFQGIDENSCVFDIGLHTGGWAEQICLRYHSILYGFEPVEVFFREAKKRLACFSSKVKLFNYGVGGYTREEYIALLGESSSIFRSHNNKQRVTIKSIGEVLEDLNVGSVDLTEINIEDGEYELLENMISTGLIKRFKQLLIQFHKTKPSSVTREVKIRESLKNTHRCLYNYPYVFEHWSFV